MKTSLILACAGKGTRAGFNQNKLLISKNGSTILEQTLNAFVDSILIDQIIITASQVDFDIIKGLAKDKATIVLGGQTRTASIKNALEKATGDIVLIHDGARPFVSTRLIKDCINTAKQFGSAIPVIKSRDTIAKISDDAITEYVGKDTLACIQTPQGFNALAIKEAYLALGDKAFNDDGEIYLNYVGTLNYFDGDSKNIKLTYSQDFCLDDKPTYRFGTGLIVIN